MKREIATGVQDFEEMRIHGDFYVDKTEFIREWWKGRDAVTLITRPRRFGKTLNMSTLNCFFSNKYADRGDLFEGLRVWEDPAMREEQGKWPVLFVTFAGVKESGSFRSALIQIKKQLAKVALDHACLRTSDRLEEDEKRVLLKLTEDMDDLDAAYALNLLSRTMEKHYGKKVLILLDEYDTPLQEAYVGGYWKELVSFTRTMFNNTFKTNPSMARGLMTGITRVSKESIFSDLNNLVVVTTTSNMYETAFGFTEKEVFDALEQQRFREASKQDVKDWYDGFTFGKVTDIYNPWSVTNYLKTGKLDTWWANTSSNGLIGTLLRHADPEIKNQFEALMKGETIEVPVDEQIVFDQLDADPDAIWSLLLATGYLKIAPAMLLREPSAYEGTPTYYTLMLTNLEVYRMFEKMFRGWFAKSRGGLSAVAGAMLRGDAEGMEWKLKDIMLKSMSSFDGGNDLSIRLPENFYHGLVLGLLAENSRDYMIKSNRESGYGRYDVVVEPKNPDDPAAILEFKVFNERKEKTLEETAENALRQIEEKKYENDLLARGIPAENIRKYGLAFRGKDCLIMMK